VRREKNRRRYSDSIRLCEPATWRARRKLQAIGQKYGISPNGARNIYGFYYTPANLCATFCTAYDRQGGRGFVVAIGGIGMAYHRLFAFRPRWRIRDRRSRHKSDIDEDDLLTFFERTTTPRSSRNIARPEGRPRVAEVARGSKKKQSCC